MDGVKATSRALRAAPFAEWNAKSAEIEDVFLRGDLGLLWACNRFDEIYRFHAVARFCAACVIHNKSCTISSLAQHRLDKMRNLMVEYLDWNKSVSTTGCVHFCIRSLD
jgi:hypothetical protein